MEIRKDREKDIYFQSEMGDRFVNFLAEIFFYGAQ